MGDRAKDGTDGAGIRKVCPPGHLTVIDVAHLLGLRNMDRAIKTIVHQDGLGTLHCLPKIRKPGHKWAFWMRFYIAPIHEVQEYLLWRETKRLGPQRSKRVRDWVYGRTRAQRAQRLTAALRLTSPSSTGTSTRSWTAPRGRTKPKSTASKPTSATSPGGSSSGNSNSPSGRK